MKRLVKDEKKEKDFLENSRDKVMFVGLGNVSSNDNKEDNNNVSVNVNRNVSNNVSNNIIIRKEKKEEPPKRIAYYLKPSTIKKIEKLANKNNMYISEFLQKLLDETLDKIIIEE